MATRTASKPWRRRSATVEVAAEPLVAADLDSQAANRPDVFVEDGRGQAEIRDAEPQHPAGRRKCLEDHHLVPAPGQSVGGGQARGPRADDGHALAGGLREAAAGPLIGFIEPGRRLRIGRMGGAPVRQEPLERTDRHRRVDGGAGAFVFARMVAHAAAHGRQGIGIAERPQRLVEPTLPHERHVALRVGTQRAGLHAPGPLGPFDHKRARHRLRIPAVDRLALVQLLVELVVEFDRTGLGAVAAARTLFPIDEAGPDADRGRHPAGAAFEAHEVRQGDDLDVAVPGHGHEARAHRAHRAVVRRERLIEHRHVPAERARLLKQVDFVPGRAQIQAGLDAGNAAADHQHGADRPRPALVDCRDHRHFLSGARASVMWAANHRSTPGRPRAYATSSVK